MTLRGVAFAIAVAFAAAATIGGRPLVAAATAGSVVVLPATPSGTAPFAARGPYTVGVRTLAQGSTQVEVWYPGDGSRLRAGTPKAAYDLKQWLPADAQRRIGARTGAVLTTDAFRDLAVRPGGPYPVVLFSHGFGGYRLQSPFLTTHLASWGFVVAAPDHRSRNLAAVLGGRLSFTGSADLADLRATLATLAAQQKTGPMAGRIDLAHVAVSGHSAGANAAVKLAASDARISGIVALAGGGISLLGGATDPKKPVLFVGGTGDDVVRSSSMTSAYTAASPPKRLVMIAKAGHLAFADVCVVDRETGGLRTLAKTYGIEIPALLDRLGTDGCSAPDLPVEQAWPIIRQFTVAQLRAVFTGTAGAATAPGLDQATADALGPARATVRATLG